MRSFFALPQLLASVWCRTWQAQRRLAFDRANRRRSRNELAQMGLRDLNDLGISRGDTGGLLDEPQAWQRDRR